LGAQREVPGGHHANAAGLNARQPRPLQTVARRDVQSQLAVQQTYRCQQPVVNEPG
jgi:hypothetical protein